MVFSIFLDHAGRLWAGTTRGGLVRIDDPSAERPHFVVYTTREGLSSNDVRAITEDHWGRIYFWTGKGVDRLQPETGAIRHYTENEGLVRPASDNNVAFCDRHGTLWFGLNGLSRLDPEPPRTDPLPPPIRITKLRIRGAEYPTSEFGETSLSGLVVQPEDNEMQIDFASLNFAVGDVIKYQYRLEGAGGDWSVPSENRTVNFPRLSPGRYRFLVRAINADGLISPAPAAVSFRVLAPVWRRWWFLTLAALAIASIMYEIYRRRLERLLELERVRTRIASDLHDDIGSGLTKISLESEVARRCASDPLVTESLEHIGDASRELVDSMSDIVWALNPKRGQFTDLATRMRYFANQTLAAAGLEVDFHAPPGWTDASLPPELRRDAFLIFKEAVNNTVRHSQSRRVEITVELRDSEMLMRVSDDGLGFHLEQAVGGEGHGLTSMRARAARLGGRLEIDSQAGKGTTVTLSVPLKARGSGLRKIFTGPPKPPGKQ